MPWEVHPVSEIRLTFVHHVLSLHQSVSEACRLFPGVLAWHRRIMQLVF